MTLERFTKQSTGKSTEDQDPEVSLRKSESIGLNQAAVSEFFTDAEAAVILFDVETNRIGIEPKEDGDEHPDAYAITRAETGATITPTAFLRTYDLVPERTTRYRPEWDDDEELVIVNLDEPVGTYGSPDEANNEEEDEENTMVIGADEEEEHSATIEADDEDEADEEKTDEDTNENHQIEDDITADQDSTNDEQGGIDDW